MGSNTVSDIPQGFQIVSQSDIPPGFQIESHPGIDFGQAANAAGKAAFNPSSQDIVQGGGNPAFAAGSAALGSIYGQAKEQIQNKVPDDIQQSIGKGISNTFVPPPIQGMIPNDIKDKVNSSLGKMGTGVGIDLLANAPAALAEGALQPKQPKNIQDLLSQISGLENKGYKLASEIIPTDQTENVIKGTPNPSVEQFFQNAQPAKTAEELQGQMQSKAQDLMGKRSDELTQNNKPIGRDYLDPLFQKIEEMKSKPQTPKVKAILKGMQDVYDAEKDHLNTNGDLDSLKAEAQKEWHGKQSGIEKGFPQETSAGTIQAHDILRDSLKSSLEDAHSKIAAFNEPYGGLTGASESLAELVSKGLKTKNPGMIRQTLGKLLPWLIENPVYRVGSIARELATEGESNILGKSTNKIADIRSKISQLKSLLPEAK